jgi:hypothetical protein
MRRGPSDEVSCARGGAPGEAPRRGQGKLFSTSTPSIGKGSIVKRIIRLPVLAGGIVTAVVLATLAPTTTGRADAQETGRRFQSSRYHNPYGQGRYGRYGRGYGARGTFGRSAYGYSGYGINQYRRSYGYSGYGITPYRYGYRFGYGRSPYIHSYGGSGYYQPYSGGIYFGFGGF